MIKQVVNKIEENFIYIDEINNDDMEAIYVNFNGHILNLLVNIDNKYQWLDVERLTYNPLGSAMDSVKLAIEYILKKCPGLKIYKINSLDEIPKLRQMNNL